jgi:hypothetical protein
LRDASLTKKQQCLAEIRPDPGDRALHQPELSLLSSVLGIHFKSPVRECETWDCEGTPVSAFSNILNPVSVGSEHRKGTRTVCFVLVVLQALTEKHSNQILSFSLGLCCNETGIEPGQLDYSRVSELTSMAGLPFEYHPGNWRLIRKKLSDKADK